MNALSPPLTAASSPATPAPAATTGHASDSPPRLEGPGSFQRRIMRCIFTERTTLRRLLALTALQTALGLGTPWLLARAVDTALPNQAPNLLAVIALLAVAGAMHTSWIGWLHGKALALLQQRFVCACQEDVLRRFLRTHFAVNQRQTFGETNTTLSAVSTTVLAMLDLLLGIGTVTLTLLGSTLILVLCYPGVALAALAVCVLMTACASVFAMREARLAKATLDAASEEHDWLHVLLSALPTLRASGATTRAMQRWTELLHRTVRAGLAQTYNHVATGIVLQAFPQLLGMGVSAWLMHDVLRDRATLGTLMLISTLLGSLTQGAAALVGAAAGIQRLRPQFARIDQLLQASDASPRRTAWRPLESTSGADAAIRFDGVSFRYCEDRPWLFEGHSQTFADGTVTLLRAESGSGKSTLLRLAAGLLVPQQGRVRVHGLDPATKSGLVTYLPQQAPLLEASIATNLTVLSGQPIERVLKVASLTGLDGLLARLPMGMATPISLRGGNLSAGQCQLIVLTAAFASASPVVVLDEATSQIDAATRANIDWPALTQDRCVIIVSHE